LSVGDALFGVGSAPIRVKAASTNVTTISAMEREGSATLGSGLDTIKAVMDALEAAGVELLGHGQPGCRLKAK
jgi:hypothetical protein